VIGEGVESLGECLALLDMGVVLQQGYLFARPQVGKAIVPTFPS
jgi:EAL domain-containing protein (putative c-di-GMP-specific phosphodiesterase class I)